MAAESLIESHTKEVVKRQSSIKHTKKDQKVQYDDADSSEIIDV